MSVPVAEAVIQTPSVDTSNELVLYGLDYDHFLLRPLAFNFVGY